MSSYSNPSQQIVSTSGTFPISSTYNHQKVLEIITKYGATAADDEAAIQPTLVVASDTAAKYGKPTKAVKEARKIGIPVLKLSWVEELVEKGDWVTPTEDHLHRALDGTLPKGNDQLAKGQSSDTSTSATSTTGSSTQNAATSNIAAARSQETTPETQAKAAEQAKAADQAKAAEQTKKDGSKDKPAEDGSNDKPAEDSSNDKPAEDGNGEDSKEDVAAQIAAEKARRAAAEDSETKEWAEITIPASLRKENTEAKGTIEAVVSRGYLFVTEPASGFVRKGYLMSGPECALAKKRFLRNKGRVLVSEDARSMILKPTFMAVAVKLNASGGLAQVSALQWNPNLETLPSGEEPPDLLLWTMTEMKKALTATKAMNLLNTVRTTAGQDPIPSQAQIAAFREGMERKNNEVLQNLRSPDPKLVLELAERRRAASRAPESSTKVKIEPVRESTESEFEDLEEHNVERFSKAELVMLQKLSDKLQAALAGARVTN